MNPGEWTKVGVDVVVGGAVGVADKLVENWDTDRESKATKPLTMIQKAQTYYDYGIPILTIIGVGTGLVGGDMARRLVSAGATIAGRQVTKEVTKAKPASWHPWTKEEINPNPLNIGTGASGIEF